MKNALDFVRQHLPTPDRIRGFVLVFFLGLALGSFGHGQRHKPVAPAGPFKSFVALGHAYGGSLAKVYASAWEDGAKDLDQGKPISTGIEAVKTAWDRDRVRLFNRLVAVELAKVIPQGKDEPTVTAAERASLASAWRSFAAGLRQCE